MSKPLFLAVDRDYLVDLLKAIREITEAIDELNETMKESNRRYEYYVRRKEGK